MTLFTEPEIKVVKFESPDVITTSLGAIFNANGSNDTTYDSSKTIYGSDDDGYWM